MNVIYSERAYSYLSKAETGYLQGKYSIRISVLLALVELYHVPVQDFFADLDRYE